MSYFVVVDTCRGKARIFKSVESWVLDYMKKHNGNLDDLIKDLSNKNGPDWAKSYVDPKDQKCEFGGKEELLRAFKNLPYKADLIDVSEFLGLFDPDSIYYRATLIK
jgi:hypothetical protein